MRAIARTTIATLVAAASAPIVSMASGEADPSFSTTKIEGFTCRNSPTLLSDKSMLVHLWDRRTLSSDPTFRHGVAKLKADGSLDTTFGQQGLATFVVPNNALNLLPLGDGRMLALGNRASRLKADGSIDPTYGQAGTSDEFFAPARISGAALLPGDTLLVSSRANGTVEFAAFTADGQRALGFGAAGRYSVPVEVGEVLYAWSQQSNGALEMATYRVTNDGKLETRVRRLTTPAFGLPSISAPRAGVMPTPGIASWTSTSVKVDPSGRVIIATGSGSTAPFGPDFVSKVSLTRFNADGRLDTSFGIAGAVSTSTVGNEGQVTSFESAAALWEVPGGGWTVLVDASLGRGSGFGRITEDSKRVVRFTDSGQLTDALRDLRLAPDAVTQADDGKLLQGISYSLARDGGGTVVIDASCTVKRLITDTPRVESTLVEYYAPSLDHYFMTLEGLEVGILDNHPEMGWKRTGARFGAWSATSLPGASRVCRFYGDLAAGPNSHFYIPEGAGCEGMKRLEADSPLGTKAWRLEGITFSTREAFGGQCPATLASVYRFYNNGFSQGKDSNHRYSIDPAMSAAMVSQGWIAEGIAFCVPPISSRQELRPF